eukprot:TRINITY_DN7710_c0_g1_i1.p1 TRINITY_DN7710_c0_g1~~TRINITY_DN7710_c0_g1_i1.p1  ORF type:complete len:381 (-),score=123.00 TRINITY_DN7710_c0_g1_i1:287-1429(-)
MKIASALVLASLIAGADGLGSLRHLNDLRRRALHPTAEDVALQATNASAVEAPDKKRNGLGGLKDWSIQDSEGGNSKLNEWTKDPASAGAYLMAIVWCSLIAMMPVGLHLLENGKSFKFTYVQIAETVVLYIWLIGGLYLFTNVLLFQSPHFNGKIRSLSLEESVYLFSQIVTTVGYGDITPAKMGGQVFVGLFVMFSFLLVAGMISQFATLLLEKIQKDISEAEAASDDSPQGAAKTAAIKVTRKPVRQSAHAIGHQPSLMEKREAISIAAKPLVQSSVVFLTFVAIGVVFFSQYPGENKTIPQAIYMSFITLSSVGFGAFTPVTKAGMVFGAFWMLFGVSALAAVISSMGAFVAALKTWEAGQRKADEQAAESGEAAA